jgi:hypothetical protein
MDLMVVQPCAVDEDTTQFVNIFKKNVIVNLFGVVMFNVKHVIDL